MTKEIGHIVSFFSGVAQIKGLPHVFLHETLLDETNTEVAIVVGFDENFVEALFFEEKFDLEKPVFRSFKPFSIPISSNYIGRIVNGLGKPIDSLGDIKGKQTPIFQQSPQIIEREIITQPLSTGIKIIDTNLPIGKGQRELIIGDRKLGKTVIAVDTILNQKDAKPRVNCIYVACGQKKQKIQDLISLFEKHNTFLYSTIVAASAGVSFAEQYLAPFVGCSIAEYFRNNGQDALIVYDDLSKHAKIYRDISLLLKRAPGREAYPGDIFSLHAGLLERAAKLSEKKGGGSLTALPIVETQESDITSFIPTNLISITDGQIYLENNLFQKGFLPAINIGLSISRIGSKAQPPILRKIVGNIRLILAQHKELQKLSQLETIVSAEAKNKMLRGDLLLEFLKQEKHTNVNWQEQVILFYLINKGVFDDIGKNKQNVFETFLLELIRNQHHNLLEQIENGKFDKQIKQKIEKIANNFKKEFLAKQTTNNIKH